MTTLDKAERELNTSITRLYQLRKDRNSKVLDVENCYTKCIDLYMTHCQDIQLNLWLDDILPDLTEDWLRSCTREWAETQIEIVMSSMAERDNLT